MAPLARQFLSLVKPRIVALLCVTGLAALVAAGGSDPARVGAFAAAGALVAGGAAALNCWYDRDLDREMERTADRPLPAGRLDHRLALGFAAGLLTAGTAVGLAALPARSVAYMWLGVAAYAGLYTAALKRRHWMGVVLGGSAGAFPVLAGWAAVDDLRAPALVMAALVFAWTPAHAWALATVYRDDFAAAGVPTLPAVASLGRVTRGTWLSALATVAVAAGAAATAGDLYATAALVASPPFLLAYLDFRRRQSAPAAVRAFFTSNLYLAVLFAAWAADGATGGAGPATLAGVAVAVPAAFLWLWRAQPSLRGVPGAVGTWRPLARSVGAGVRRAAGALVP